MKAADVMTSNVISIEPNASILQAIRLMLQHRISGLPVTDTSGAVVGILTEGDLLRRNETGTQRRRPRWLEFLVGPGRLATEYVHASGRKVHEVMTRDVHSIGEESKLDEVVALMERHRIKRLPVLKDKKLVGIVSRANLIRALAQLDHAAKPIAADDVAIRERLQAELKKQPWAPVALVDIMVSNGTVQLWGTIMDDRQREALIVAAENIPGVKGVQDHLVWVEPMSGLVFPAA